MYVIVVNMNKSKNLLQFSSFSFHFSLNSSVYGGWYQLGNCCKSCCQAVKRQQGKTVKGGKKKLQPF